MRIPTPSPRFLRTSAIFSLFALVAGCSSVKIEEPGISKAVCWNELPGWEQDKVSEAIPALLSQCPLLSKRNENWNEICQALQAQDRNNDLQLRAFMKSYFTPYNINGTSGKNEGLITGYYEPTLYGSLSPNSRYNYPLYKRPTDMLTIDISDRYPALKNQRVRGRVEGNKVVSYYSRAEIDSAKQPLKGQELLWVDDADAAFFLQIQGSGRVQLPNGEMIGVGYADQNGHAYVAIGKVLIENGEIDREDISLATIRHWLRTHPNEADSLKNQNPSYVFFDTRTDLQNGPRGSLNVPLTPERSAAVDRKVIPLGTPLWVSTTLPDTGEKYQRLVIAQDTGGAITGPVRADMFFGRGDRAELLAGEMKQKGSIYALIPKKERKDSSLANCK